jgi:hypothetical protein
MLLLLMGMCFLCGFTAWGALALVAPHVVVCVRCTLLPQYTRFPIHHSPLTPTLPPPTPPPQIPQDLKEWVRELCMYNVPHGKLNRGVTTLQVAKSLGGDAEKAAILGWYGKRECVHCCVCMCALACSYLRASCCVLCVPPACSCVLFVLLRSLRHAATSTTLTRTRTHTHIFSVF